MWWCREISGFTLYSSHTRTFFIYFYLLTVYSVSKCLFINLFLKLRMLKRVYIGQFHLECRTGSACVALKKNSKLIEQHALTFLPHVRKRPRAYSRVFAG